MKVLYVLLLVSIAAIMIAVGATLWRLRWHLRRPNHASQHAALNGVQPDHEPVEKI
ncbi:MAG TPA: hypothetical protein VFY05_04395 [Candidatus Angelobacter sp.]|nr:hypothetical protein [Candidatus Angelobacter sp.]